MAKGTPARFARLAGCAMLAACLLGPTARADEYRHGSTRVVAVDPSGAPADGGHPSLSSDGRYVAFDSWDPLVPADTDARPDVYRRDMVTGETILVSSIGTADFSNPSLSGDGTKMAYLAGGCFDRTIISDDVYCPGGIGIYHDLAAGTWKILGTPFSVYNVKISRNGLWVAVLDEGEYYWAVRIINPANQDSIYVATVCSACVTGYPDTVAVSATGRYVAFESDNRHVDADLDEDDPDVYRYDRDADGNGVFDEAGSGKTTMELVGIPEEGDVWASRPAMSEDGRVVAFFASGFTGRWTVQVRDLVTNKTKVVSRSPQGAETQVLWDRPAISGDGRMVAFIALDAHLVPDTNPGLDVFVHDRVTARTEIASILPDGSQGIGDRMEQAISADGRFLAFRASVQGILNPLTTERTLYLRDLAAPCTGAVCLDDLAAPEPPPLEDPPIGPLPEGPDAELVLVDPRTPGATTAPLAAGTTYTLEARGAYNYSLPGADRLSDAHCVLAPPAWAPGVYPNALLTLEIDGAPGAWVPVAGTEQGLDPRCSQAHAYRTTVTGTGAPLALSIRDNSRSDDAGAIAVAIAPAA